MAEVMVKNMSGDNSASTYIQDNENTFLTSDNIPAIVSRIEKLLGCINEEFLASHTPDGCSDEAQVEMWSQEISLLSQRVNDLEVHTLEDLRAKVTLSLSLITQSHVDRSVFEKESEKIIKSIDSFKRA